MNYFLKGNKNLLTYTFIILIIIPVFGIKFFFSFLGNIILLLFLIPILLLLILLISINSYKSKINTCNNCGTILLGVRDTCINCGENLENNIKENQINKKPSESIIEVKAEEIR